MSKHSLFCSKVFCYLLSNKSIGELQLQAFLYNQILKLLINMFYYAIHDVGWRQKCVISYFFSWTKKAYQQFQLLNNMRVCTRVPNPHFQSSLRSGEPFRLTILFSVRNCWLKYVFILALKSYEFNSINFYYNWFLTFPHWPLWGETYFRFSCLDFLKPSFLYCVHMFEFIVICGQHDGLFVISVW